ncbi:hypothetical protein ACWY4P_40815 [Streptomyces sp. LZ34]
MKVTRDPKPQTPAEAEARKERVAKLHQQAAAEYRTGFGKPKTQSKQALAA